MKYDKNGALLKSEIPELPEPKRGKVRDIYEVEDALLLIATDLRLYYAEWHTGQRTGAHSPVNVLV